MATAPQAPVAQLDRVSVFETEGWRFEPVRARQLNPVFVKRILVKLSKAKLAKTTVGKSGGYGLARSPKSISLLDIYSAVNPPNAFAIHAYPKTKECVVSCNIKEVMSDVLVGTQEAVRRDLRQTTLADVVSKIRARSG